MVVEILIISLVYLKVKGRDIRDLGKVNIKKGQLIVLGFILQILSVFFIYLNIKGFSQILINKFIYINFISYLLIILGIVYNVDLKGFKFILLGMLLNLGPIILNGGRMPVYKKALIKMGDYKKIDYLSNNLSLTHMLGSDKSKLFLLTDIIPLSQPYIFPKIISIGDIILAVGLLIFIYNYSKFREND